MDHPGSEFTFDLSVYRLSAVQKAAYRFTGSYCVAIDRIDARKVGVTLTPRTGTVPAIDAATLPNEVLDQELRETVADETRSVRELLLAQTFSNLPLTDPSGENADYNDDPLRIADAQRSSR